MTKQVVKDVQANEQSDGKVVLEVKTKKGVLRIKKTNRSGIVAIQHNNAGANPSK